MATSETYKDQKHLQGCVEEVCCARKNNICKTFPEL